MILKSINFLQLKKIQNYGNSPKPTIYYDDKFYYKIINNISCDHRTSLGYYILDGLDWKWLGMNEMSIKHTNLITKETIPAFHEFIYDGDICCGYSTHRGEPMKVYNSNTFEYMKFLTYIKKLVDHSIECGWGYVSLDSNNIIEYNGEFSFIDLDFAPIKLNHGFSFNSIEQKVWENEFRSDIYFKMLSTRLN
jgi:hypothetical protein